MKVLITAGTVYGRLDDNKLVGNRIRGIWATKFASWLHARGFDVTLLVPDTMDLSRVEDGGPRATKTKPEETGFPQFNVLTQNGYDSYAAQCYALAPHVNAAVMAAAVVNWIPAEPIKGKMKTEGFAEGAIVNIPFVLAPRVIDRMRKLNPKLTLIGCKMTSGAEKVETLRQAYGTLLKAHCNVVIANDLSNLKEKMLVYPDGHGLVMKSFEQMYEDLLALLGDKFYRTETETTVPDAKMRDLEYAYMQFNQLCDQYRDRFKKRPEGPSGAERVFGSLAVRIDADHFLVSPREKGVMFDANDAVVVTRVDPKERVVFTVRGRKATLNAPLLIRVLKAYSANTVVHLHEDHYGWPTYGYAPPGTARDNDRMFAEHSFNIEGHGCVFTP